MPFVNIKIAGPALAPERIIQLQRAVTSLMAGVMRKKGELTAVLVEQTPSSAWSIGGEIDRADHAKWDGASGAARPCSGASILFVEQKTVGHFSPIGADDDYRQEFPPWVIIACSFEAPEVRCLHDSRHSRNACWAPTADIAGQNHDFPDSTRMRRSTLVLDD